MIDPAMYVKIVAGVFSMYGVQMLFTPAKLITDHFDIKSNDDLEFAWRGHAASTFVASAALLNAPVELAHKLALAWVVGIGVLYPLNAKFNIFGSYKIKYPMHYVPEFLMTSLAVAGVLAFF